jgi:hypothetical protein
VIHRPLREGAVLAISANSSLSSSSTLLKIINRLLRSLSHSFADVVLEYTSCLMAALLAAPFVYFPRPSSLSVLRIIGFSLSSADHMLVPGFGRQS